MRVSFLFHTSQCCLAVGEALLVFSTMGGGVTSLHANSFLPRAPWFQAWWSLYCAVLSVLLAAAKILLVNCNFFTQCFQGSVTLPHQLSCLNSANAGTIVSVLSHAVHLPLGSCWPTTWLPQSGPAIPDSVSFQVHFGCKQGLPIS